MSEPIESPGPPWGFSFAAEPETCIDLRPTGLIHGTAATAAVTAGIARLLAGGPLAYTLCEVFLRAGDGVHVAVAAPAALTKWAAGEGAAVEAAVTGALDRLSAARPPLAGVALDRPRLMGVVNVTPDSFHAGSATPGIDDAVTRGLDMIAAGADIIDVGGESTRPGSEATAAETEIARVVPVIAALAGGGVPISVDTRRAEAMTAALAAGATMVNDVTALTDDARALAVVAEAGAAVVLMHMLGRPRTMQDNPVYDHAPYEILRYLRDRVAACERAGIPRARIAVDPGIGFGKTDAHNLRLLSEAAIFHGLGCTVAIGASRKSFIGRLAGIEDAGDRLPGSLAAVALAAAEGVQILRVHDVAETRQALAVLAPDLAGGVRSPPLRF